MCRRACRPGRPLSAWMAAGQSARASDAGRLAGRLSHSTPTPPSKPRTGGAWPMGAARRLASTGRDAYSLYRTGSGGPSPLVVERSSHPSSIAHPCSRGPWSPPSISAVCGICGTTSQARPSCFPSPDRCLSALPPLARRGPRDPASLQVGAIFGVESAPPSSLSAPDPELVFGSNAV